MEKIRLGTPNGYNACNLYTEIGDRVATVCGLPLHTGIDEIDPIRYKDGLERARFIVRACNNHGRLLAALKEVLSIGFLDNECHEAYQKIIDDVEKQS